MEDTAAFTEIFDAALKAVNAGTAVRQWVTLTGDELHIGPSISIPLPDFPRIIVIGAGKAAADMAFAMEVVLGERIQCGEIVVKYEHTRPLRVIRQYEAGHPIPDTAGVAATSNLLELIGDVDARTLVIVLLSGGGSALLVAPAAGIDLAAKQATTVALLRAGADIAEINAVRKHLSTVKGGLLARRLYPARVVGLVVSDVLGDELDVIASGPLTADASTFNDALSVLQRYQLQEEVPPAVTHHLKRGACGELSETPKRGDNCFTGVDVIIVARIAQALAAARERAEQLGYRCEVVDENIRGDTHMAAKRLANRARETWSAMRAGERVCLLAGGETTLAVRGQGLGGRNQELALVFAREIQGCPGVVMVSVGTDGTDGPTNVAGARVDSETWALARALGIDAQRALDENDSFRFFAQLDARMNSNHHIETGPTGTNVMDMQIILIKR